MARQIVRRSSSTGQDIYRSARSFGTLTAPKFADELRVILDSFDGILTQSTKVKLYCHAVAGAVAKAINDGGHADATEIILNASDGESMSTRMEWIVSFMSYAKGSAEEWAKADAMAYLERKERLREVKTAKTRKALAVAD